MLRRRRVMDCKLQKQRVVQFEPKQGAHFGTFLSRADVSS